MDEPKPLNSLFEKKLFRIPDYQRGYAWQPEQLKDFWEDLMNLPKNRKHYTGVLTLKQASSDLEKEDEEYFLVKDRSFNLYHVVDGQQRLTTFVIFLQAFIEFVRTLPENRGKSDSEIFISGSLSIAYAQSEFLFEVNPLGIQDRAYKFGYTTDNPSYRYLRYRIFDEAEGGSVQETFYTLNLSNAKRYFSKQLKELHKQEGSDSLRSVYEKLTQRFLFNEYIIKDDFDVFVSFETMNNRGKQLSTLELLKNRLIYLTTLYNDDELDSGDRHRLRNAINDAWKEVYYQLGRNKKAPLNDDDFLRAHWIMYFRMAGGTHENFLLNEEFTPQKVHEKGGPDVHLEVPEERRSMEANFEDLAEKDEEALEESAPESTAQLQPREIKDYVNSLKESVVHWFNSFYPYMADGMDDEERHWIERLNRIGMTYFRPLVMAVLKNERDKSKRIEVFRQIERFIFIAIQITWRTSNYRASEFYRVANDLDNDKIGLESLEWRLENGLSFTFNEDRSFRSSNFEAILLGRFESGNDYYTWPGLRYFLYEYELSLHTQSRQKKVEWEDLLRPGVDRISIEHIYPQTETEEWASAFGDIESERKHYYKGSLGNLLLLSGSINSSLQNDSFANKKKSKYNSEGKKVRNGYSDGSHSEIEVSQLEEWGPDEIRARGLGLLRFMERRWNFSFQSDEDREKLLFLRFAEENDLQP